MFSSNSPIVTASRLLTFRCSREELQNLNFWHLTFGLLCTWIVGIGRWWEDPKASLLQHTGIGSVAYVFILALFLWLIIWPLTPPHWSFLNVLIFVTLTSPPAALYALPVRHGLSLPVAQTVRLWLLAIVAGWRVALLGFYLRRGAGLAGGRWLLAAFFPLLLIVFVLTSLNLEKVVFDIMGGIHESDRSVNDAAYGVLMMLTLLSVLVFLPALAGYLVYAVNSAVPRLGIHAAKFFYVLAFMLAAGGVGLGLSRWSFLGIVLVVTGGVIAWTTAFAMNKRKDI
jgi:hypothetical protein